MKIIRNLLIALVAIVVVLAAVGLFLPDRAHVERSITIEAPASAMFSLLNGFGSFNQWSPWYERDPDAEYRFEGPATGVGAKMYWSSNEPDVGSGSQEIIEIEPGRSVKTALDFGAQGTATATFIIEPAESGSTVTWSLDTEFGYDLMGRWLGVLFFDKWIGGDYEKGLESLKRLAEGGNTAEPADIDADPELEEPAFLAHLAS